MGALEMLEIWLLMPWLLEVLTSIGALLIALDSEELEAISLPVQADSPKITVASAITLRADKTM